MHLFSNLSFSRSNFFNLLVGFLPISFIAGNLIININVILLILSALFFYRKNIFLIEHLLLDKLIISIFLLILITGVYNDLLIYFFEYEFASWRGFFSTSIKSFLFLKYLLIYYVLRFLIEKEILDLKIFFIICGLSTLFVSFDLFYQLKFGKDIFGYEATESSRKLGGPFGDELIAGGYLQRFSLFSFFIYPFFYPKLLKKSQNYLIPLVIIIFIFAIVISGNRMPLILYIFSIFLILLFQKNAFKKIISSLIIISTIIFISYKSNPEVRMNLKVFQIQISKMVVLFQTRDFKNNEAPPYFKQFVSFYDTWLMSKYIGGGIKNFRYYCHTRPNVDESYKFKCNMHPHNYYLEILTETGLLGLIIILTIFYLILVPSSKKILFGNLPFQNNIGFPFLILFITEIFPFRSSGSFFTTNNTTYLFLLLAIIVAYSRIKKI